MSCPYAHYDGAYVLGSLSAAERAEYERHLAGCDECATGVRELAGLPGLLARVSPDVLDPTHEDEPVPETLLPGLVARVRRDRRRRSTAAALLAAAATVLVIGGTAIAVRAWDDDGGDPITAPPPSSATSTSALPAQPQRMTSLGSGSVTGWISLTEDAAGTRLDLTCTYESSYGHGPYTYTMTVRTADGRVEQVKRWRAMPGEERRVTGTTSATVDEIVSVVVRTADGYPVLRLAR
ncbi:MAG TPA: zf-HC2 domain-containing protein [Nocardioides sp.]|nr:zf-HC2 domain-containing protein [Nocardioides sp.]